MNIEISDELIEKFRKAHDEGLAAAEDVQHRRGTPLECMMRIMSAATERESAFNAICHTVLDQIGIQSERADAIRSALSEQIAANRGYVQ